MKHNKVKFNVFETVVPHSPFHKCTPLQCINTGSPSRYVVYWNHIAFNLSLLAGIRAHFHQLLHFQEVRQPFILVYSWVCSWCYSCLLGQHSQFSILHFIQTLYHHNMFALLCTFANHFWWCLLLARSQYLQPSSSF